MTAIDLTDQRFGKLTVINRAASLKPKRVYWLCQCDCGKQVTVCGKYLRNGETRSCGCLRGSAFSEINLVNNRFGKLVVLERVENNSIGEPCWLCECDCGTRVVAVGARLRKGQIKSCGCFRRETAKRLRFKHGKSETRTHRIWMQMQSRCSNPNDSGWKYYGGRGIRVCDRWNSSFEAFLEDMGECPEGYSIERIDVNGNYEPSNCKWIPLSEQGSNTRNNVFVTYQGETKTIAQWARVLGMRYATLRGRIAAGMTPEEAFTKPIGRWAK